MRKFIQLIIFILIYCFGVFESIAQTTRIIGKVIDANTEEPLPFVNVYFKGKNIGTTTNFEGSFTLETKNPGDSLDVSFVGYLPQKLYIQKNKFHEFSVKLNPNSYTLKEVVILPGENPAEVLLRKMINNKIKNDKNNLTAYQYEVYNKIQFDANNITDEFKNKRVFKPFKFIFENIDTSTVNGKIYLPLFLTESVSDFYYRQKPKANIEVIKGSKVSGIDNESISQFLGDMYQNVNVYDNYIILFDKNFVSPVADFGLMYYKYYLTDSTYIDNQWCYKVMFKPRRKQELTFVGDFWVHDTTYAVKNIEMRIVDDANINFINDLVINQKYTLTDSGQWMLSKDQLIVDFNIFENTKSTMGFYGKKTTSYKNFVFNKIKPDEFYNVPAKVVIETNSTRKGDEFWNNARHDSLGRDEKAIYKMVDTVKTLPAFRTYVDIIRIITTGYKVWGDVELGPYFTTYSFNKVEGHRFRFGGRTSNEFSTKIMLSGHVAYGTEDEKFKYGTGLLYMFSKNPRKSLGVYYKNDVEQLGQSQNAFREDNILASIFRRNPSDKLSLVEEYKSHYEYEWFNGFSNTIHLVHRKMFPLGTSKFEFYNNGAKDVKNMIVTSEIRLDTRFAYREKFVMGEFERISLGTTYPVIDLKYTLGISNLINSDYDYHKLQIGVKQWYNVGTFGWSRYIIEAGQIWGKLPYPLLKLHEGNETFSFDEYAYNLMNYYEFVSDRYVSVYYTHHFDGLFLNKIPFMRKLKWREVTFAKGVIGSLQEKNKNYSVFPLTLNTLDKPYFEAGVGVENIFKIIRIDGIWRLSHLDHPKISKFAVMATLQLSF